MRKNRIYTIKERKKKKKIRLLAVTTIILAVVAAIGLAIAVSFDSASLIYNIQNTFTRIDFSLTGNKAQANAPVVEANDIVEEEKTTDSTNLTMDVLSQDLEPVDPSVGADIWASKELPVFSDETLAKQIGSIIPETMYEVIECVDISNKPYFRIETTFGSGFVEASYCLIDLVAYLGTDKQINLVNRQNSPIKVCGFPINDITGQAITGIEDIDGISNEERVLLSYPTAVKFEKAMKLAKDADYTLCLYEAVRTDSTVTFLHDTMESQLEKLVAQKTYNGVDIKDFFEEHRDELEAAGIDTGLNKTIDAETQAKWARAWYNSALENHGSSEAEAVKAKIDKGNCEIIVKNLPAGGRVDGKGYIHTADGKEVLDEKGYWTWADFDLVELPTYTDAEGNTIGANTYGITFEDLMIKDGEVSIDNYFEKSDSDYTKGYAVDVVLLNTETDNAIPMQSDIYDMSLISNPALNNDNSKLLSDIMSQAGFEADAYVWWHFTDKVTK